MRVRLKHVTEYVYDEPASLGPHMIRLQPAPSTRADILSYSLDIEPEGIVHQQTDPWSNRLVRVTLPPEERIDFFRVTVDAAFDIRPVNPFDFYIDDRCNEVPFAYPDGLEVELAPFLQKPELDPAVELWLDDVPKSGYVTDWLVALNQKIAAEVGYVIRLEPGLQSPEETLAKGSGSCRDSAWLLVTAMRARGLAARFVSGYSIQLADEGVIPDMPRGLDRDVVDLHAWAEVYIPGAGWVGLDATSGLLCGEGHIPLAATVVPSLAAPITGTSDVVASDFRFEMSVERLGHEPRPRHPYTDESYEELLVASDRTEERLRNAGLTLTVGGEPTWTSREHPEKPEWNLEALGDTKWDQGLRLARELSHRIGDGALGMHCMGKQYPGESLPRWNLPVFWRRDGVPIWRNSKLLDFASEGTRTSAPKGISKRFIEALARRLEVNPSAAMGAYEDPWVLLRTEANLPVGVSLEDIEKGDDEDRRRIARQLQNITSEPVGWVLPLGTSHGEWIATEWHFRRERLFLVSGDSPLGYRLPLDRIGASAEGPFPVDPFALPTSFDFDPREVQQRPWVPPSTPPAASNQVRTALCTEVRGGVLHVFVPPVPTSEHFLALMAAVEDCADEVGQAVRIEGYQPQFDPRIERITVTPDPGVIEVNVPVANTTREYADTLMMLRESALHAGLTTERYQLDGREVGTGGGNHITLGGPSPASSPFLRQPDLLASMLRFFQNHPSLSYLFTGLFVGPTSQAPRVDEGRHEALYELELALSQLDRGGPIPQPWFIDRLLRNLVVDITGNTHRTEICIDKLYNPSSPTGRLGILELRAFEMPPHERMAVAIVYLLRTLVAYFAERPYRAPMVRWGTRLHDEFLLPHFLWEDLSSILQELRNAGFEMREEWFRPFVEYRFPVMGRIEKSGIEIELRPALEPWPVLGEEPTGATVSRFVDSSLERLQVRVFGLADERHAVSVNGVRLPLRSTGRAGEYVAGVKFRAWQPPHCLQPHIGIHHPLHFDVVDMWAQRSLGAGTYHVWHPDGKAFDEPPLTLFEANARRASRFTSYTHLPYPVRLLDPPCTPEYPTTLDLRWLGIDRPMPFVSQE